MSNPQKKEHIFRPELQEILDGAKSRRKGDYSTYEDVKNNISRICDDQYEYMAACKELSNILQV